MKLEPPAQSRRRGSEAMPPTSRVPGMCWSSGQRAHGAISKLNWTPPCWSGVLEYTLFSHCIAQARALSTTAGGNGMPKRFSRCVHQDIGVSSRPFLQQLKLRAGASENAGVNAGRAECARATTKMLALDSSSPASTPKSRWAGHDRSSATAATLRTGNAAAATCRSQPGGRRLR